MEKQTGLRQRQTETTEDTGNPRQRAKTVTFVPEFPWVYYMNHLDRDWKMIPQERRLIT